MALLPLEAQDIAGDVDSSPTESTTDSIAEENQSGAASTRDLERETLPQDIESLSFFQLVNWLERLGLSTQGDLRQLQLRLYEHYQIDPAERSSDSAGEGQATIESALAGDYFSIAESDEKYVRLQGGVLVEFIDSNENVTHTIEAQELIINQDEKFFTARGEVHYTITRESGSEEFFGNTLTFQTDDWDGYLLQGRGVTQQSSADSTIFRYQAEFISRSTDDIVVMEDVTITSSPALDPYYRLEASKVWILGEGEWGLQDATLYVGEIPLFYFPYFFRPGDEILFHPVFGAREREGFFIQTTTYFIGRKPPAQDRLSFLQRSSPEGRQQIVDGIFLRDSQTIADNPLNSNWYLKLLIDYYSRLGAYVALDGQFNELEPFERFRFETAVAASRHIFPNGAGNFTTLYHDGEQATEQWVETSFLGIRLPIRYFMDVNLSLALDSFRSELFFEIYSDRFITQDYGDRAEENDWFSIIAGAEEFVTTTTASTTNSFQWRSSSSLTFAEVLNPFISQIQFSDLTFSLNWLSRNANSSTLPDYVRAAHNSPQNAFFYPSSAVAPNVRFEMNGALLSPAIVSGIRPAPESTTDSSGSIALELRPPWELESEEENQNQVEENEADSPYRAIEILDSHQEYRPRQPLDYVINYDLDSNNNIQFNTNNRGWRQADDVNFDLLYSTYTSDNQLRLGYLLNLYENYLRLEGASTFTGRYRTLLADEELSDTERTRLRNQSYNYNLFDLNNTVTLSSFFLQELDSLRTSSLAYTINTNILRYNLSSVDSTGTPQYQTRLLGWDTETITSHLARLNIVWNILEANQSLQVEYRLPPLDQRLLSTLGLQFGPLALGVTFTASERANSDIWNVDPLMARATLTFLDELALSSQLTANLENSYIDTWNVALRAWFFNAQFNMKYSDDVQFDPNFRSGRLSTPWVNQAPRQLRPANVQASINETFEIDPLWKNRIRFSFGFNSNLLIDLQRFTQSNFRLGFNFSLSIHEFLEISLSSSILNDQIYLYIPELAAITGRNPRNFFVDLLQSFNIFNPADLEQGLFKLQNITLRVVHHLVDWDLEFEFSASPTLVTSSGALPRFVWDQKIGILVTWRPIPELRKDIDIDREGTLVVE